MKLDVYTSISNQFKPEGDIVDNFIRKFFRRSGYNIKLRRFKGGDYPSKKQVIGNADIIIAHIDEERTKVGKGSIEEVDYGIHSDIPVLLASKEKIYKYTSIEDIDNKNWRFHANLNGKILDYTGLRNYLRNMHDIFPDKYPEDPFIDDSDHQKGSDKRMLF